MKMVEPKNEIREFKKHIQQGGLMNYSGLN